MKRVLITNDDGYDSPGIELLAAALRADGHAVTIVAPSGQRSGSGMKMTLGDLPLVEHRPGEWSVDASPADAVSIGLRHVMRDAPPDLVVSGANFGQNIGNNVFISGTVGAAMTAVIAGVPAVAISVGMDLAEAASEPPYASTRAAFPRAAAFTAELVSRLAGHGGASLLPAGHMLNVNYPAVPAARIGGARWTRVSAHGGFRVIYPVLAEGKLKSWIEPDVDGHGDGTTDAAMFARDYITLSLLKPDWNADEALGAEVRSHLGGLAVPAQ